MGLQEVRAESIWWLPVVACAVAGAWFDTAPSVIDGWNAVLTVGFVGLVALATAHAPSWSWPVILFPPFVFPETPAAIVLAAVALLIGIGGVYWRAPNRLVGGVVGGLGGLALLHLESFSSTGASAALAALVTLIVAFAALANVSRRARLVAGGAALVGALAVIAITAGVAGSVLSVRTEVDVGTGAADRGVAAARRGDTEAAAAAFDEAGGALTVVAEQLRSPWVRAGLLVPVLSQHVDTADRVVAATSSLSTSASAAARGADLNALTIERGEIDTDALAEMAPVLRRAEQAMRHTVSEVQRATSPWLTPPITDELERLQTRILDALPQAEIAAEAAEQLPSILGSESPRTYLVVFGNPAEARELGGLAVNFVEVQVAGGRIAVSDEWRFEQLEKNRPGTLNRPESFSTRFLAAQPETFARNWTSLPDMASTRRAIGDLYPSMGGRDIDGVMYIDPLGLAAVLELTGPVRTLSTDQEFTADEIAPFLLVDQYTVFPDKRERVDFLAELSGLTILQLLSADVGSPERLGRVLGPAARGGHIQFITGEEPELRLLELLELDGGLPDPDQTDDAFGVLHVQGGSNKLDPYLSMDIDYRVELHSDKAALQSTATIELRNDAPLSVPGYVANGEVTTRSSLTNHSLLSILTPNALESVTVDGTPIGAELQREGRLQRYLVAVDVPIGEPVTVVFELSGTYDASSPTFSLALSHQALANDPEITIELGGIGERTQREDGGSPEEPAVSRTFTLEQDLELVFDL